MRTVLFFTVLISCIGCATPKPPTAISHSSSLMENAFTFDLQGHRGARGLVPENTIPAFKRALDLGVTTLEMDVVITKDNQVVVSHEPWFSGHICSLPSGDPVPVAQEKDHKIYELTYEQVKQYDCGQRGNPGFPYQEKMAVHKPLLSDVIAFAEQYKRAPGEAPILYNIETKSQPANDGIFHPAPETFTKLLLAVLEDSNILDRATIQSFDPRTLRIAHAEHPEASLALLVGNHDEMDFSGHVANLGFTPRIYSPSYKLVNKELVEQAHARNMQVIPWTVNTLAEMHELLALNVDGIITDYPNIGRQILFENED